MLEVMGKILSSLVRSLFVSAVMLLIVLSVLTGEFPPSVGKVQKMFVGIQKISDLNANLHSVTVESASDSGETDVLALQQLNKKRAEIGSSMFGETSEVQDLKETVRDLQRQVSKLQSRVAELEDISSKKSR